MNTSEDSQKNESKINTRIRHARIAAMVSGTITFAGAITIIVNQKQQGISLLNILSLIDVVFIFGMAYGIYRKSRVCAVLMFEYFLFSKVFNISASPHFNTGVFMIGIIFLYFMFQGISGTYAYHKCKSCREGSADSRPFGSILAGSCGLIAYVLVLPVILI